MVAKYRLAMHHFNTSNTHSGRFGVAHTDRPRRPTSRCSCAFDRVEWLLDAMLDERSLFADQFKGGRFVDGPHEPSPLSASRLAPSRDFKCRHDSVSA
jgi:hypothetical protein